MEIDLAEAQRFLHYLDLRPDATFHFQTFDDDKKHKAPLVATGRCTRENFPPRMWRWEDGAVVEETLEGLSARGAGVYIAVNEHKGRSRRHDNFVRARAIYVDLDGAPLSGATGQRLQPSMIVRTRPDRWHVYWLLDLDNNITLPELKELLNAASAACGGDRSVNDAARVLRLPGFPTHRVDGAPLIAVEIVPDGTRYSADDVRRAWGSKPAARRSKSAPTSTQASNPTDEAPVPAEILHRILDPLTGLDPIEFRHNEPWFELLCAVLDTTTVSDTDAPAIAERFIIWSRGDPAYRGQEQAVANRVRDVLRRRNHIRYEDRRRVGTLVYLLRVHKHDKLADEVAFHDIEAPEAIDDGPAPDYVRSTDQGEMHTGPPTQGHRLVRSNPTADWSW